MQTEQNKEGPYNDLYLFRFKGYRYNNGWNYEDCRAEIVAKTKIEAIKKFQFVFNLTNECIPEMIDCKAIINERNEKKYDNRTS